MKNQLVLKELSTAEVKERLDNERAMYQKMLMSHELGGFLDEFPIFGVFHLAFHQNDDGLLHLVADHDADSFFS